MICTCRFADHLACLLTRVDGSRHLDGSMANIIQPLGFQLAAVPWMVRVFCPSSLRLFPIFVLKVCRLRAALGALHPRAAYLIRFVRYNSARPAFHYAVWVCGSPCSPTVR